MSESAVSQRPLSLFEPDGPLSAAAITQVRTHPRFGAAIRALASGMLGLYRGNRLLNMVINDRGRMLIAYYALYLDARGASAGRGTGFSVGELKATCAAAGVASPGRTAAMLAVMASALLFVAHCAERAAAEIGIGDGSALPSLQSPRVAPELTQ
jgi:hypothetical protein